MQVEFWIEKGYMLISDDTAVTEIIEYLHTARVNLPESARDSCKIVLADRDGKPTISVRSMLGEAKIDYRAQVEYEFERLKKLRSEYED